MVHGPWMVYSLCFIVHGAWFRDQGPGSRVQGPGFRDQGAGCRVQGPGSGWALSAKRVLFELRRRTLRRGLHDQPVRIPARVSPTTVNLRILKYTR